MTTLQGPNKDFALHTIGWQAFQDLAVTIVEVEFGRAVTRVAPSRDQGRDGFFAGLPEVPLNDGGPLETTIQCKHFGRAGQRLTLAGLGDELVTVRALASSGRAHGYILVTNASLTEAHRVAIVAALREAGVGHPYVFGSEWVSAKILEHPRVRALAPRVYGLGDLSWITSDVARRQALAILDTMGEGLRCYVPTKAHRQAVRALERHRFVLLLGDPAVGKSSIAAALAVGATDAQGSDVFFVRNPGEFLASWDPDVENRLFWIDDAFGATKLESALMDPWNKMFSTMQAAIRRGNRFILTSRSHIWRQAGRDLKQGAFPPLLHGNVVVDVEDLGQEEKERILYNHLRFGGQPSAFKLRIRPHLDAVLAAGPFSPEIARRLADPAYTGGLTPSLQGLTDFFARPEAFLLDTLINLPDPMRAAIGLIFIKGGRLRSPIETDEARLLIEELYGVTAADLRNALQALAGSFVLCVTEGDNRYWTYKHPTIGDAYARLVGRDQELVTLYVRGTRLSQLLDEARCGGERADGIVVPPTLYDALLDRFPRSGVTNEAVRQFLVNRAGPAFLKAFLARYPELVTRPAVITRPVARDTTAALVVKAAAAGCLPQEGRDRLLAALRDHVEDLADVSFLVDEPRFTRFLTDEERAELVDLARDGIEARFTAAIDGERDSYESSWEPADWFEELRGLIAEHRDLFPDDPAVCAAVDDALLRIDRAVAGLEEDRDPEPAWDGDRGSASGARVAAARGRSIFDDLV